MDLSDYLDSNDTKQKAIIDIYNSKQFQSSGDIIAARNKLNVTQKEASAIVNVPLAKYIKMESGFSTISINDYNYVIKKLKLEIKSEARSSLVLKNKSYKLFTFKLSNNNFSANKIQSYFSYLNNKNFYKYSTPYNLIAIDINTYKKSKPDRHIVRQSVWNFSLQEPRNDSIFQRERVVTVNV